MLIWRWTKQWLGERIKQCVAVLAWWLEQNLIALDQMLNTLIGGFADETFSARCWRRRENKTWRFWQKLIDAIFFWQSQHCLQAYQSEQKRRQLPPEYERKRQADASAAAPKPAIPLPYK